MLRPIESRDAVVFAEWEKAERPYPWSQDQFLTHQSSAEQTWVWAHKGHRVGYAVIKTVEKEAHLLNFMIEKQGRRQGLGTKFMKALFDWCERKKVQDLYLDVDPANAAAVSFYLKVGFELVQFRSQAYPRGEDALLLRKKLFL